MITIVEIPHQQSYHVLFRKIREIINEWTKIGENEIILGQNSSHSTSDQKLPNTLIEHFYTFFTVVDEN